MKFRVALAGASILALMLVGCSSTDAAPIDPSVEPVSSAPAAAPPTETPEPSGPPALACNTLITQETIDGFEAAGYVHEVDFESQLRSDNRIEALFFDYGGLACLWYLPNSDGWFTAGYSQLTDEQAREAKSILEAENYLRSENGPEVTYSVNPEVNLLGHNDTYVFVPGAWFHSNHPEGVQEIRTVIEAAG